jgi:flavin-dependent dehydrogenase
MPATSAVDRFDACVVGAGPAGAIAAYTLARVGARVALILNNCTRSKFAIGETVSPETRLVLNRLGVNDCLTPAFHLPSTGNTMRWGSNIERSRESIFNCYGHGWHIDRPLFDHQLVAAATGAGAYLFIGDAKIAQVARPYWKVVVRGRNHDTPISADYLLDCTGKSALIAIRCGNASRRVHDKLIAIWTVLENTTSGDGQLKEGDPNRQAYIESTPDGWFYSVQIPMRRRVVAYFFDGDLMSSRNLCSEKEFFRLIRGVDHLRSLIEQAGYRMIAGPVCVTAMSAKLEKAYGRSWIAAGDAAQSFDPLSSQGIISAIIGGNNAAAALISAQTSGMCAFEEYQANLDTNYAAYLSERQSYYGLEQRWRDRPFWLRRIGPNVD